MALSTPPAEAQTAGEANVITPDGAVEVRDVRPADLNGDGRPDLLVASKGSDRIGWSENLGGGDFSRHQTITQSVRDAWSVAAGDLDGDGDLDVVSGAFDKTPGAPPGVAWYENQLDENGGFSDRRLITSEADGRVSVEVADIDGDGVQDIVYVTSISGGIAWVENEGNGTFGSPSAVASSGGDEIEVQDIDGDGAADVAVAPGARWYSGDGTGGFSEARVLFDEYEISDIEIADIDEDGDMDVLTAPGQAAPQRKRLRWHVNDGSSLDSTRVVVETIFSYSEVRATDLSGDGDLDIVASSDNGDKALWIENRLSEGTGFSSPDALNQELPDGEDGDLLDAKDVASADIDGDGSQDPIATSPNDGTVVTYENRLESDSTFGDRRRLVPKDKADQPVAAAPADLDGDGDLDLLVSAASEKAQKGGRLVWYENRLAENGRFSVQSVIETRLTQPENIEAADVDMDGDLDVIVDAGTLKWHENRLDEGEGFSGGKAISDEEALGTFYIVGVTDVGGDDDPDVLVYWDVYEQIQLYENQLGQGEGFAGKEVVYDQQFDKAASDLQFSLADLDGDGAEDVLFSAEGEKDGRVGWLESRLQEGEGFSDARKISDSPREYLGASAADLTGDGVLDVATSYFSPGVSPDGLQWHKNRAQGDGGFSMAKSINPGTEVSVPRPLHMNDLNGDGAPDLAVSYAPVEPGAEPEIVWLENRRGEGLSGDALFSPAMTIQRSNFQFIQSLRSADLDGDGLPEVLSVSKLDDKVVWYDGFASRADPPDGPALADTTRVDGSAVDPGAPVEFEGTGVAITFSSGTEGTGDVVVGRFNSPPQNAGGAGGENISQYRYEISIPTGGLSVGDSSQVRFAVANLPGIRDPSQVRILSRETPGNGKFTELGTEVDDNGTPNDPGDDELVGLVDSFSEFAFASESEPLPVEMARFEGTATERGVRLTWRTASETSNAGFEVQRKIVNASAAGWQAVGFVESKAEKGTTDESQRYRFEDSRLPFAADCLKYRLRQMDLDGTGTLTDPVQIERTVEQLRLKKTLPNPARGQATVQLAVPERQDVRLRLYDVLGRKVQTVQKGELQGRQELQVDLSSLPSGTYFLRLIAGEQTRTRKLTITR